MASSLSHHIMCPLPSTLMVHLNASHLLYKCGQFTTTAITQALDGSSMCLAFGFWICRRSIVDAFHRPSIYVRMLRVQNFLMHNVHMLGGPGNTCSWQGPQHVRVWHQSWRNSDI